jgi:ion channel
MLLLLAVLQGQEFDFVLSATITAIVLVTVTAGMHVAGFGIMLRSIWPLGLAPPTRVPLIALLIQRVAWWLIFVHVLEIGVWASFYRVAHCFPDAESAFYFSGITYTTVGYGDLLLPVRWRILSPIESLTGILMCGLSASAFFALVNMIVKARSVAGQK